MRRTAYATVKLWGRCLKALLLGVKGCCAQIVTFLFASSLFALVYFHRIIRVMTDRYLRDNILNVEDQPPTL